jgi:hypothetical protein
MVTTCLQYNMPVDYRCVVMLTKTVVHTRPIIGTSYLVIGFTSYTCHGGQGESKTALPRIRSTYRGLSILNHDTILNRTIRET